MTDNTLNVPTEALQNAEMTFATVSKLSIKNQTRKAALAEVNSKLTESEKEKVDLVFQCQQERIIYVEKMKDLAIKETEIYQLRYEKAINGPASNINSNGHGSIPKIPEFTGSTVGFNRWINWVSDLFSNYPQLTDFNRRMMIVDALKGEARSWYDAEPDENTTTWEYLKEALLRQFGGTNSITNALKTISAMKLTTRSDFNSFIVRIRPAIQIVAKNDNVLAIAMLRNQIDPEIKRFIPEIENELFAAFETRVKLQCFEIQPDESKKNLNNSDAMEIGVINAPIQKYGNAQYVPNNRFGNRNPMPHIPANTTMAKSIFDEYVKNCYYYGCGKRGHLRTMCTNNKQKFKNYRNFNAVENEDSKESNENDTGKDMA
ncbi:hypothetical protein AYI70_g43 [Smittium culicis]|uniref:CCHC-type domain-containing protein n=1 Tax=Smittium culicis TaxID=133412 RepID=A0A1R1YI33_9FUNG|nr:hypothetical protein AYI70_g43 [Smittium culicis]